ncbi:hypothetical protein [Novosphingobium sp. MBES04]|uniref:hypothetical protein n=1 Tax=Novosphingobium sp. MBES04 TaxID=1206458 RepID=UPI00057CEC68|nr:hypothetical protein [Novosphingobium sp. MBES04]GAM06739.1 hypothetical conserved protein [Novosphingobium sp. MBES04]
MTQDLDWIARSGARAKGGRPAFFDEMALDRLYSLTLSLTAELAATRERLDTVERLLELEGSIDRTKIERYEPDRNAGEERGIAMRAYIARVMRGFQQEVEAMEETDPPVTDWVEKLSRQDAASA